ncbi:MAG TPA: hypothetical protein DCQ30_12285 [Acidimicrobiaceae bacterium]|nr:hypothetical protein [Acidimicrobiaceae bacterium]
MARRIDIELTSQRPDGSWTWRAPGARQPRGDVAAELVPSGVKVGDVLRADAEFDLDGIVVTAVLAQRPATRSDDERNRIEVLGPGRSSTGVSVTLAPGSRRRAEDDERGRGRRGDGDDAGPRRTRRPGAGGDRARRPRTPASDEAGVAAGRPEGEPPARRPRREEAGGERRRSGGAEGAERAGRPRRLQPAATYRNAALADLRPEQLPVAEQLLRGGIPALRAAIDEQNSRARAEGRAPVSPEPLLAMAEELLPKMNLATWKDRATAVRTAGKDAPLREVRSVVAGASAVALDEEGRALLSQLRQGLDDRVTALRHAWLGRVTSALDEGRVADALRLASRAPEPAARIPAELAVRLSADAGAAMGGAVPEQEWLALLDAVVGSPVRRTVKPAGLPEAPSEDLLQAARRAAGQVPELARLLGLPIPPPPGPRRPAPVGARRT